MTLAVFIGYDPGEGAAFQVARRSLEEQSSIPLHIVGLNRKTLQRTGMYSRTYTAVAGQYIDDVDGKPFSTEFTFTRFLVPALMLWHGTALFIDSDFMFRSDVAELLHHHDPRYAVQCVQHDFTPAHGKKMRGQEQAPYPRKAWSSLMLFTCGHAGNRSLTPEVVNTKSGRWLHQLQWLEDGSHLGALPRSWNWLEGHDRLQERADAVHYTRGTPDMPGYTLTPYSDEWRRWLSLSG